jgi:hypothetical protein
MREQEFQSLELMRMLHPTRRDPVLRTMVAVLARLEVLQPQEAQIVED